MGVYYNLHHVRRSGCLRVACEDVRIAPQPISELIPYRGLELPRIILVHFPQLFGRRHVLETVHAASIRLGFLDRYMGDAAQKHA